MRGCTCVPGAAALTPCVLTIVATMLMGSRVVAQSMNVDLDITSSPPTLGGGAPSNAFGAASGQTGAWNSIPTTAGPVALFDLAGSATSATLSIPASSTTITTLGFNNPNNTGDFRLLMNDAQQIGTVLQGGTRSYTFAGLVDGPYSVYTYGSPPQPGNPGELFVDIPGSTQGVLSTTGAHAADTFALGTTHVVHTLNVVGGTFTIRMSDIAGSPSAYVNGFQLILVPEPEIAGALVMLVPVILRRRRILAR